jgi:AraC-like DNA-binding protein
MTPLSIVILEGSAKTQSWSPDPRLEDRVISLWALEVKHAPVRFRTVPDGQIDLIFNLDSASAHVTAPVRETREFVHDRPVRLFGASLASPYAVELLGHPLNNFGAEWTDLSVLTSGAADDWISAVAMAPNAAARVALAEAVFLARPGATDPRVTRALGELGKGSPVTRTGKASGASERTLGRLFHHWVGMPPKTFSRILRVQNAVAHLRTGPVPLKQLAADAGFADQAHMNREILAMTGMTPGELADLFKASADLFKI